MTIDHEITVWCEARGARGEHGRWFARLFDRATYRHYGGSGGSALEAAVWAIDEYVRRGVLGGAVMAASPITRQPGDGLAEQLELLDHRSAAA